MAWVPEARRRKRLQAPSPVVRKSGKFERGSTLVVAGGVSQSDTARAHKSRTCARVLPAPRLECQTDRARSGDRHWARRATRFLQQHNRRRNMSETTPTTQVAEWLAALDTALTRGDAAAAAALFDDECYWRDLVSFTWNITTAEGPDASARRCSSAPCCHAKPTAWRHRGRGHRGRRRDRRLVHVRDRRGARQRPPAPEGRQVLDAADHDDRAEGLRGEARARRATKGVEHGVHTGPQDLARAAAQDEAELGYDDAALRA